MKKLVTFLACLLCFAITILLAGCAKQSGGNSSIGGTEQDEGIPFTVQYDASNGYWQNDKTYPALTVVRTYDQFISYKTDSGSHSVDYGEDYFDGNFVVIAEYSTPNGGITYVVNKVVAVDNGLTVYISRQDPPPGSGGGTVMGVYISFIGISNTYSVPDSAITLA